LGVWAPQLRSRDPETIRAVSSELAQLGYGALWAPGAAGGPLTADLRTALAATSVVTVASGVLNIWMHDAVDIARWVAGARVEHGERLLLGLGVSHPRRVTDAGRAYRPMTAMRAYLDALDAAADPVLAADRVLAALGPQMLALARERSAGVHTYLTDPTHTAVARDSLGEGPLLAPEVKVILHADRAVARDIGRAHLAHYLGLDNYTRNLLRSGWTAADLSDGGSDRLIDGLFAIGDVDAVRQRVRAHRDAGADHVCMQVVTDQRRVPWDQWRQLAVLATNE